MDKYYLLKFTLTSKENETFKYKIYDFENIGFAVDDPADKKAILEDLPEWEVSDIEFEEKVGVTYEVYFEYGDQGKTHLENLKDHLVQANPQIVLYQDLIDNSNWEDEWKKTYKSFIIGKNILIKPSWEDLDEEDKIVIEIEPKMAFGTGTHETTALCMVHIEDEDLSGKKVLDIGCGSGILSILAKKLGASQVQACDIDPIAVASAKDNAQINGVDIEVYESNLFENVQGKFDLVFANILAEILVKMIGQVNDFLTDQGRLVLSGIIKEKLDLVKDSLKENNFEIIEVLNKNEWYMVAARRKDV